jgi:hypothetical protein
MESVAAEVGINACMGKIGSRAHSRHIKLRGNALPIARNSVDSRNALYGGNCDSQEDAEDENDDHQLDYRKAALPLTWSASGRTSTLHCL